MWEEAEGQLQYLRRTLWTLLGECTYCGLQVWSMFARELQENPVNPWCPSVSVV